MASGSALSFTSAGLALTFCPPSNRNLGNDAGDAGR